ncbi:MAG: sigma-70 family RNA polymerase sigma factor, partial [Ruminococcus bromii]
ELTVSQLAERLDTSEEKIIDALNSTRVPLSLTAEYDSEGNPQLDVPTDDIQDEISERLSLEQAVKSLCETDRKIIQLRYYRSKTQTQTAKILSMTQVQISRREKKILTAIRDKMSV